MNENLPKKDEKGLLGKIKKFFKNLFYKPTKNESVENSVEDKKEVVEQNNVQKEKFTNSIKVEVDNSVQKELEKNDLFEKIRKNPELLDTLSNNQLENLSIYYDKIIEKNREIIANKKAELEKLKKIS